MKYSLVAFALLFISNSLYSQNSNIPAGEYFAVNSGVLFKFTVAEDGLYQLSMADGKIEIDNDEQLILDIKSVDIPIFGVKYETEEKPTDSLTIKFDDSFKSYYSSFLLIGEKDSENGSYNYKTISELGGNKKDYTDQLIEIKIPNTKYISFLQDNFDENNIAYNYEIPEKVSAIKITYNRSKSKPLKLSASYNNEQETVTISENGTNPLVFRKNYEKFVSDFETPSKIEKNVGYEGSEINKMTNYGGYENPYNFKLQQFDDYKKALQKNKEENKILIVYYLPDNQNSKKEYSEFVQSYEQYLSYLMYDVYKENLDTYNFYLANENDKNLIKQFKLDASSLIALVDDGDLLVKQNADFNKLSKNFIGEYGLPNFESIYMTKRLDNLVTSKKFDANKALTVFKELSKINSYESYGGANLIAKLKASAETHSDTFEEYYKLKSTQSDVDGVYGKLIDSHKNDATVNVEFAHIISKLLPSSYDYYGDESNVKKLNSTDFQVIDYLLKFKNELKAYQPSQEISDYEYNYYFYDLYPYTIENALKTGIEQASESELQAVKSRLEKLYDNKIEYLYFLQNYIPEEFLSQFQETYNSNFGGNENVILQLNEMYEASNSDASWKSFKNSIATQQNSAAWNVVEGKGDKSILKEALKWSRKSLRIDPENPYYLDTLAQLLYLNGDKDEAIKTQEQAIAAIKNNATTYDNYLLEDTELVLKSMKDGTYVQKTGEE